MNLSTVFAKMAMLILIMLLGYLCARIGITGPEFNKRVTPLMVTVLMPATILNSVLGAPAFQAIEIVDYILVLTVMVVLQMLPAWLLPRLLRTRGEDAGAMRLTTAFWQRRLCGAAGCRGDLRRGDGLFRLPVQHPV